MAISRRDALRTLAATGVAAVSAPFWVETLTASAQAHAEHYHAAAAATTPWTPKVLSPAQNATVVALAELIVPETDTPGATKANVNQFIDATLAGAQPAERQSFLDGLAWLDTHCQQAHQATFVKLTPEQQTAVLTALSAKSAEAGLKPGGDFFTAIKSLTVTGYYTSEVGMREEIGDDGTMFFAEFKGCTHPEHQ